MFSNQQTQTDKHRHLLWTIQNVTNLMTSILSLTVRKFKVCKSKVRPPHQNQGWEKKNNDNQGKKLTPTKLTTTNIKILLKRLNTQHE